MSYNTRTLGKRIAALSLVIGLLAGTFLPSPGVLYAETPDSSSVVDAGEPSLIGADGAVSDAMDVLSSVTSALSESTSSAAQSAVSSDSTESVSSESVSASSVSESASDSASVPESNAEDSSMSEGSEPADSDSAVSSSMSASVSESASAVQSESTSAADSASTENDTVDEADEPFNALAVLDPKPGHDIKAKAGDEITLTSGVNRDDVLVSYQWQRMQLSMPKEETVQEEIVPLFDYDEASPTWYSYPLTDMTEYELLQANPDAAWQGVELYRAAVDAFDAIGEDTASLTFAWRTPNYVLDGYSISAERVDDVVRIYADKDDRRYTAVPNAEGAYEFSAESSEYTVEELLTNVWEDIEGATEPVYTFTVSEADLYATYRLAVTIEDETYLAAVRGMLEESDMALSDEQESAEQVLYSVVINLSEDVLPADSLTIEDTVDGRDSLVSMFSAVSTPKLSADGRWIEGLNGSYEYITKDTYDRVTAWYKNEEISPDQYKFYWTKLGKNGSGSHNEANVLDENGRPTGATRVYMGFNLVEGNKLEVASEWYGKTVLFRPVNTNSITEIKIPAYTELYGNGDKYEESSAGSTYKKNVVFLNPYVKDTGSMYYNYLKTVSDANGWLIAVDGSRMDIHVSMYTVDAESFNADPQRYMVDAEGNYRVDAVGWGVCTNLEPDLSGKAYWTLKDFIANGYGFLTGHDTMYAYAGAYYDAHDGADLDESSIDPNDGTTWYYDRNSWQPGTTATSATGDKSATRGGHFYMNELMGTNAGNVYSGTVDPSDAPSKILSAGGSNGRYGKNVLFGTETLNVVQTGYSAQQAASNPRYRTPTNYPFSYTAGNQLSVAHTHTNEQVAFGPVWINYYGTNKGHADHGFYADPMTWYLDGMSGTNNFYLSGDGNYLMNQVGHLPENSASKDEAALFANSIMYVSQRKQCEICAANQGHQTSHFVHRVSVSNADAVLKALQQGGTYWYPIDGCYQLVDDIQLPDDWTPIAGFKGHWNSDVYDVTLGANGQPLLKNDSADGESGWNLGTNSEQGTVNVFNSAGVRTTGVARVVGDLNDLFGTSGVNYTGYVVKILGSDNPSHMGSSEVYACTVNTDSKYVISNLPCVYDDQDRSGVLTARVYKPDGTEVTEYGSVHVNVSESFWNTDMTTPLYLGSFKADPVEDFETYESAQAYFTALGYSDKKMSVTWQYRTSADSPWVNVPSDWDISKNDTESVDGGVYVMKTVLTLRNVNPAWNGYEFRAVFNNGYGSWNTYGYYHKGAIVSNDAFDGAQYEQITAAGKTGKLTVNLFPTYTEQSPDETIYEGESVTFESKGKALVRDAKSISAVWQYSTKEFDAFNGEYLAWHDVAGDNEFDASAPVNSLSKVTTRDSLITSLLQGVYSDMDMALFDQNASFYELSTSLTVNRVDITQSDTHFRVKYTATTSHGTSYTWYSNMADDYTGRWVTSDGTGVFSHGAVGVVTKADNSNVLTVLPPVLVVKTTPAASLGHGTGDDTADTFTPDMYGQFLVLPAGDLSAFVSDTAYYQAVVYVKPTGSTIHQPNIKWQYTTFSNRVVKDWTAGTNSIVGANGRVNIKTDKVASDSTGDYAGYDKYVSTMSIVNPAMSMYDSETLTKYFFRCIATVSYETVKHQGDKKRVMQRVDQWGGLALDYSIGLQHNGVLTYNQQNIINGVTVNDTNGIVSSTKDKNVSWWSYPKLSIKVPDKNGNGSVEDETNINTAIVYFDSMSGHEGHTNDRIDISGINLSSYGVKVSSQSDSFVVLSSITRDTVSIKNWNAVLRAIKFYTQDKVNYAGTSTTGGLSVKFVVDELRYDGLVVDPATGAGFELVKTSSPISWDDAKAAAEYRGADTVGVNGTLARVTTASEASIVKNLLTSNRVGEAWLGGKNDGGWRWYYGQSVSNVTYSNWVANTDTSKKYMIATTSGWKSTNGTEISSKTVSLTNLLSGSFGYTYFTTGDASAAFAIVSPSHYGMPYFRGMDNGLFSAFDSADKSFNKIPYWPVATASYPTLGNYMQGTSLNIPAVFRADVGDLLRRVSPAYDTRPVMLDSSHKYLVHVVADSKGDNNGVLEGCLVPSVNVDATNSITPIALWRQSINWDSNAVADKGGQALNYFSVIDGIGKEVLASVWNVGGPFNNSNPLSGTDAQLHNYAIYDLTAAFGSNEALNAFFDKEVGDHRNETIQNWFEGNMDEIGRDKDKYQSDGFSNYGFRVFDGDTTPYHVKPGKTGTFTYTTKTDHDVYAYVVRYDLGALSMRTTNHSASDNDKIGTGAGFVPLGKEIVVQIADNSKVYDGQVITPASFEFEGPTGVTADWFNITYEKVSGPNAYTKKTVSGGQWKSTDILNAGMYKATVQLKPNYITDGYSLSSSSQSVCSLIITPRPVDVSSVNNDRVYDGTAAGVIRDIVIDKDDVVSGDTVRLNTTSVSGFYLDDQGADTIHNSKTNHGGLEYSMRRDVVKSPLYIQYNKGEMQNYVLGNETYSGDITQRGLDIHSIYLEDADFPRNIKAYDGTDIAVVSDILIDNIVKGDAVALSKDSLNGTYATFDAGESLDENGKVLPDRFLKLEENVITLTETPQLVNNDYDDYYIANQAYSGAIYRASLEAIVDDHRYVYGDNGPGYPVWDTEYSFGVVNQPWLHIDGLVSGDVLTLDDKFSLVSNDKDGNPIEFTNTTDVGEYPVSVEGLNETNYPLLENYIVSIKEGVVEVYPREIAVTAESTDWYAPDLEGIPVLHASFAMKDDTTDRDGDGDVTNYLPIGDDLVSEYTDMSLVNDDTIASVLLSGGAPVRKDASIQSLTLLDGDNEDLRRTVMSNGSTIVYNTEWYLGAPALFLDIKNDPSVYPCEWCEGYHGFELGTDHWHIDGYRLSINQNTDDGDTLDIVTVENPLGETVKNYKLVYIDGLVRQHPELRFQLEATVPMQVCMYGYGGDGEVVEPTNYGITNYSNGMIEITDIDVSDDGWNIVDKPLQDLLRGEMTMKVMDTQLVVGNNKPRNPDRWVIDADHSEDSSGVEMLIPMTCFIAGGNVNKRQESYVTRVTYTIAEHGLTVPSSPGFDLPDHIDGEPVVVDPDT